MKKTPRVLEFTPYTQRPVELWMRYHVLPKLLPKPPGNLAAHLEPPFEIDEALGGTKAPLTARMSYLQRHLGKLATSEIWPKLSIAILADELGLQKRMISRYRQLEEGVHAREEILEILTHRRGIFIYERDIAKLAQNLASFDAFICAYTALLADTAQCTPSPHGFPAGAGWVSFPAGPQVEC